MNNNISTTTDLKHKNRNNVLGNILASIIGRREKVDIIGETDELNNDALVRRKFKPRPIINNNTVKVNENPVYNEYTKIGGKPKKFRKSRKTRKNRKSKRKL